MPFLFLNQQIEKTCRALGADQPSVVVVPYRIAPLGAHVDHQGGPVLGAAIDDYSVLAFVPNNDGRLNLQTDLFDKAATIDLHRPVHTPGWARYAAGAAFALDQVAPLNRGLNGFVTGGLIGAGLSSSASVGLAYLLALAAVNQLVLTREQLVELDRIIENEFLGLSNGIQDQTTIVFGRAEALIHQDTRRRLVTYLPHAPQINDVTWLLAYSGFRRELVGSGFNDRVAECREAARRLDPQATMLSDISPIDFEAGRRRLPEVLHRRATHFFSEVERVEEGAAAWQAGDWAAFGQLMNRSCHSSITQYESGSRPIINLHEMTSAQPGVWGSRFCGGGYGGCVIALAEKNRADEAGKKILADYLALYPEKADIAHVREVQMVNGASVVKS